MTKKEEIESRKNLKLNKQDKFILQLQQELIRERQIINNKNEEIERLNNIINQFENRLKNRIKAYEDRQALGKGYELTDVMEIQLIIDRKYLKELQELKENKQ